MDDPSKDWWASENAIVDEETMARICCMEETIHAVENTSETLSQWQRRTISFMWDVISVSDDSSIDRIMGLRSFHSLVPLISKIIENRCDPLNRLSTRSSIVEQEQTYLACLGIISAASARGYCDFVGLSTLISHLKMQDSMVRLTNDARTVITGILFNVALTSKTGLEDIAKLLSGCDLCVLLKGADRYIVDALTSLLLGGISTDGR